MLELLDVAIIRGCGLHSSLKIGVWEMPLENNILSRSGKVLFGGKGFREL